MNCKCFSLSMAFLPCLCVFSSYGDEVLAPSYLMTTVSVQSASSVVQEGAVTVADEGSLTKCGKGNWTIRPNQLQPWNATVGVGEGRLTLDCASADAAPAATLPAAVAAKALFWVDAEDPDASHVVNNGGNVSVWYDRREPSSPTTPKYMRANALPSSGGKYPQIVTMEDGKKAVYFGGLASGRSMEWLKADGSRWAVRRASGNIKHVFAVHTISNSLGTIFGNLSGYFSPFAAGSFNTWKSTDELNTYWFNNSTWQMMTNGRGYLNGERFDGTTTSWQKGRQMLEAIPYWNNADACVDGFFAAPGSTEYRGGDYLCEALVFTNVLSEVERLQVSSYLMRKWMSNNAAAIRKFKALAGAEFAVDTGASDFDGKTVLTGEGTVVKQGTGTFVYQSYDRENEFAGSVDVQAGKVQLRSPAAVLAKDGARISVTNRIEGPTVAVSNDAGSGKFVKEDSDLLTVNGLPESIKNVSVKAGTLAVRAPVDAAAAERYYEVPIQNGDFEDFATRGYFDNLSAGDGVRYVNDKDLTYGWISPNWGGLVMDFERWTGTTAARAMDYATAAAWGFTHPPSGKCGLILVGSGELKSALFHLEKGSYRLQYAMQGRMSDTRHLGAMLLSQLIKSDGSVYGEATNRYAYYYGYRQQQVRIDNLEEGDYRFYFKSVDNYVVIDDVRLFRVEAELPEDSWKIPNGDFEGGQTTAKADMMNLSASRAVPGWTFTQSSTWTAGKLADVGVSTLLTTNTTAGQGYGVFYNCSRYPQVGAVELVFCRNGAKAESTFRPPAGVYALKCDMARFGLRTTSSSYIPTLTARVTIGGETVELGSISPKRRMMDPVVWAKSFAVDGSSDVTLTLESSGMGTKTSDEMFGLLVDDFALVTRTPNELFQYGDCEATNSVLVSVPAATFGSKDGWARCRLVAEKAYSTFGRYPVDGKDLICIENLSMLYEDVYLPFAGRYRLSFYAHSRLNDKYGSYRPNPLGVTVAADGKTINLGTVDTFNSDWVRRTFDFNVPSSGVWRVAIRGLTDSGVLRDYRDSMIDSISLRQIPDTTEGAPAMASDVRIRIAAGAKLKLDFKGTNTVKSVRFGGVSARDVIDAASYPDYVTGEGALTLDPDGFMLIVR